MTKEQITKIIDIFKTSKEEIKQSQDQTSSFLFQALTLQVCNINKNTNLQILFNTSKQHYFYSIPVFNVSFYEIEDGVFNYYHRLNCVIWNQQNNKQPLNKEDLLLFLKNAFKQFLANCSSLLVLIISFMLNYDYLKLFNSDYNLIDNSNLTIFNNKQLNTLLLKENDFFYTILTNNEDKETTNPIVFNPTILQGFSCLLKEEQNKEPVLGPQKTKIPTGQVSSFFSAFNVIYLLSLLNKTAEKNNYISNKLAILLSNNFFSFIKNKDEINSNTAFLDLDFYSKHLNKNKIKSKTTKKVLWTRSNNKDCHKYFVANLFKDLLARQCKHGNIYSNLLIYNNDVYYKELNELINEDNLNIKTSIQLDLMFNSLVASISVNLNFISNLSDSVIKALASKNILTDKEKQTITIKKDDGSLYVLSKDKMFVQQLNKDLNEWIEKEEISNEPNNNQTTPTNNLTLFLQEGLIKASIYLSQEIASLLININNYITITKQVLNLCNELTLKVTKDDLDANNNVSFIVPSFVTTIPKIHIEHFKERFEKLQKTKIDGIVNLLAKNKDEQEW